MEFERQPSKGGGIETVLGKLGRTELGEASRHSGWSIHSEPGKGVGNSCPHLASVSS